jgi:hypothetical protein
LEGGIGGPVWGVAEKNYRPQFIGAAALVLNCVRRIPEFVPAICAAGAQWVQVSSLTGWMSGPPDARLSITNIALRGFFGIEQAF